MNPALTRAICALLVLALSGIAEPLLAQSSSSPPQAAAPTTQNPVQPPIELPESPGSSASQNTTSQAPQQPVPPANQPSGTATAPAVQTNGGAASKPAGVAIAPPKQHQVRSLLIKLGFLAGAGVALGTVAALSAGSPGHVPNSPGH